MTRQASKISTRWLVVPLVLLCPLLMAPTCGGEDDEGEDEGEGVCLDPGGCGTARIKLTLVWPDEALKNATKQILVVISEIPGDGACTDLWNTDLVGLRKAGALLNYPEVLEQGASTMLMPPDGTYALMLYALPNRLDLLCQADSWCEGDGSDIGDFCVPMPSGLSACGAAFDELAAVPVGAGCVEVTLDTAAALNEWRVPFDPCGESACSEHGACGEASLEIVCTCDAGFAGDGCDECADAADTYPDCQ